MRQRAFIATVRVGVEGSLYRVAVNARTDRQAHARARSAIRRAGCGVEADVCDVAPLHNRALIEDAARPGIGLIELMGDR